MVFIIDLNGTLLNRKSQFLIKLNLRMFTA